MKHTSQKLFSLLLLLSNLSIHTKNTPAKLYGRSIYAGSLTTTGNGLIEQAEIIRTHKDLDKEEDDDSMMIYTSAGLSYSSSRNEKKLGSSFSPNGKQKFNVNYDIYYYEKEGYGNRTDISNVNFFLGTEFTSSITFEPKFETVTLADLKAHIKLDNLYKGLWLNASLPIIHAKWDLRLNEDILINITDIRALVFQNIIIPSPYASVTEAFKGDKQFSPTISVLDSKLKYGKIDGSKKKTKVGNAHIALGYNFVEKTNYHLAIGLLGIFNGDSKTTAEFLNTPVIGLAGRYAFGGRLDASMHVWENTHNEINAYLRCDIAHVSHKTMRRSFDFIEKGPWSRYLLLSKKSDHETTSLILNAINVTSLQAQVGGFTTYDANMMVAWSHHDWNMNFGYNLAGMTEEKHKGWKESIKDTYVLYSYNAGFSVNPDNTYSIDRHIDGSNGDHLTTAADGTITADNLSSIAISHNSLDKKSGLMPSSTVHNLFANISYKFSEEKWVSTAGVTSSISFSTKSLSEYSFGVFGGINF